MVTKWDLIDETERAALNRIPFGDACSGCGIMLTTEGDFARHFVLTDRRYLNLGNCRNQVIDEVLNSTP